MGITPEIEAIVKRLESLVWGMLPGTAYLSPMHWSSTKWGVGWMIYHSDTDVVQVTACPVRWIMEAVDDLPALAELLVRTASDVEAARQGPQGG